MQCRETAQADARGRRVTGWGARGQLQGVAARLQGVATCMTPKASWLTSHSTAAQGATWCTPCPSRAYDPRGSLPQIQAATTPLPQSNSGGVQQRRATGVWERAARPLHNKAGHWLGGPSERRAGLQVLQVPQVLQVLQMLQVRGGGVGLRMRVDASLDLLVVVQQAYSRARGGGGGGGLVVVVAGVCRGCLRRLLRR